MSSSCDPTNCSTSGLPVHHQLPEFTQTHVHGVSDAIQPSHPLSSLSPLAPNPSQQAGIKIAGRNINNLSYADDTTLMAESEEELKSLLMETVADFIFLGSKITADGYCCHEIKRCLLLERKAIAKLDSVLKSRDITLPPKVHLVKAMVFPVVMYGCESWTIRKAKHRRIDVFEL